jgi:DNA invertase Pin-like site-specific DNA recombinase
MSRNRALVYIRKSVVRTGADTVSPERQREACLAEAARHGWIVEETDVYADAEGHSSGKSDARPGWQALLRRVQADETVAAVIVESLSRASRSVRSFLAFVDELRRRGIALVSLRERFDTSTAIGQAMLGFIAIINQLESDLAAERMKSQIEFKKRHGRHWGYTPFGCEREPATGALRPSSEGYALDGQERRYYDALRRCYELYARGQMSFYELALQLNAEGWRFRARDGRPIPWDRFKVRSTVAMARIYAGFVPLDGAAKDRPQEWVEANYEPVLPRELCERVDRVWRERAQGVRHPVPPNARESPYILSGILFCSECGGRLKGAVSRRGVRQYRHDRATCGVSRIDAEDVEAQVLAALDWLELPEDVLEEMAQRVREELPAAEDVQAERVRLQGNIRGKELELERLLALALETNLDAAVYRRQLELLSDELRSLREALARLETAAAFGGAEEILERLRDIGQLIRRGSWSEQREALASLFERVEAGPQGVTRLVPRDWCAAYFADFPQK